MLLLLHTLMSLSKCYKRRLGSNILVLFSATDLFSSKQHTINQSKFLLPWVVVAIGFMFPRYVFFFSVCACVYIYFCYIQCFAMLKIYTPISNGNVERERERGHTHTHARQTTRFFVLMQFFFFLGGPLVPCAVVVLVLFFCQRGWVGCGRKDTLTEFVCDFVFCCCCCCCAQTTTTHTHTTHSLHAK